MGNQSATFKNFFTQSIFQNSPSQNSFVPPKEKDYLVKDIPDICILREEIDLDDRKLSPENISYDFVQGNYFRQLKEQGNKLYKSIDSNEQPQLVQQQLLQVKFHYEAALKLAQSREDKSSINKNLANTNFKLILCNCGDYKNQILLKEGINQRKEAVQFGQASSKPNNWFEQIINTQNKALKFILNQILRKNDEKNVDKNLIISQLQSVALAINNDVDYEIYLIIYKHLIDITEQQIEVLKQSEDLLKAEKLQHDLNTNIKNIYQISKKSKKERIRFYYQQRFENIDKSIYEFESHKLLTIGNSIYKSEQNSKITLSSYKFIESEIIWEAVDAYKAAIRLYEGQFLHIEAECYFMLGQIYLEIFGIHSEKVRTFTRTSISLQLNSSRMSRKQWYLEAQSLMKIFQKERVDCDQAVEDQFKIKNKKIFDKIAEQKLKGHIEFIKWITKEHLPSDKREFQIEEDLFRNTKKLITNIMRLYHGDKIVNQSQHFKFIAKEIMLILNEFYEEYK